MLVNSHNKASRLQGSVGLKTPGMASISDTCIYNKYLKYKIAFCHLYQDRPSLSPLLSLSLSL